MTPYFELYKIEPTSSQKRLEYILSAGFVNISQQIKLEKKTIDLYVGASLGMVMY